jgi:hypothetical protein
MGARPITVVMDARTYALSLPEAEEQVHHGMASFRVRGKIFATVPDAEHIRVMAGEAETLAAVATDSTSCDELYWGRRLACVVVDVRTVPPDLLRSLLTEAWLRKAPRQVAQRTHFDS